MPAPIRHHTWPALYCTRPSGPLRGVDAAGPQGEFSAAARATPVLIVEDEMLIAWRLSDLLEDLGFADVRTASSFTAATAAAAERAPGLLVCDVNLGSGPDGVATATGLRAGTALPVIFITGYAGEDIAERVRAVAGAELLRKPIEPARLIPALKRCLEGTRH